MFEKSLYDLIRGMRNHKGREKEYIQNCLRECRGEVRSQDMDVKATALLKLIYLEMVGHDMSWASFHVLEVMSSPKYHQKRVGYLGAVQSFRPETEVLMLATNLLKKDLTSAQVPTMSLPVMALPHVITPSLAMSVLSDLLPRLAHSKHGVRKKTIVTLYRLALVYPETLRAAWPKIKERLMDKGEDESVTAAIVNVVCELGWRRPHDFLPLAPRLFELLVEGDNNWMAIKLIKLFATLTPLEPRLVRKLLPPLTEFIRKTSAMSLLYECIHGVIQGGILGSADDISGREEIATLCVNKLRGMMMMDGDPNLTYVALLAFNKIVVTHPFLVSQQEDVILECIDSSDITIRVKALDLVQGMVSSENLAVVVGRLMKQLRAASHDGEVADGNGAADSDEEALVSIRAPAREERAPPLPDDYRADVVARILAMCSLDNYSHLADFDWYIDVLVQLVRMVPAARDVDAGSGLEPRSSSRDVSERIGDELRNVAVKVKAMRGAAVRAADLVLAQIISDAPLGHSINSPALKSVVFMVGEFASQLGQPEDTLAAVLQMVPRTTCPDILATSLQAAPKMFSYVSGDGTQPWTAERKSRISLLMARMIHVLGSLALHPSLEVQERAVEYTELLKLTAEAASGQPASSASEHQDPPLLLTQAIPSLFSGWELNSVAAGAQLNVPPPDDLDLDQAIHANLAELLAEADKVAVEAEESDDFYVYYNQRPAPTSISSDLPAMARLESAQEEVVGSYQQQADEESYLDADTAARRRAERVERNRDDPFYIPPSSGGSGPRSSTPIHSVLQGANGADLDIDSIPIMKLELRDLQQGRLAGSQPEPRPAPPRPRQKLVVARDETLEGSGSATPRNYESENNSDSFTKSRARRLKQSSLQGQGQAQSLLQVDSSNIRSLSLEGSPTSATTRRGGGGGGGGFDFGREEREEAEMSRAVREVERLRLEMQRANERIQVAQGVDAEGTVVTRKKAKAAARKKGKKKEGEGEGEGEGEPVETATQEAEGEAVRPRRKKKKKNKETVGLEGDGEGGAVGAQGAQGSASLMDVSADAAADVVVPRKKKKKKVVEIQE